jgi:hypothetical protein
MAQKTIEQMVEEVKERAFGNSTRSDSGYDSQSVGKVVPSGDARAIAYELKGSSWHRGGTYGGGVSNFQGINAYDGETDLVVRPSGCYRAKYYHEWDVEDILGFRHLEGRRYEMHVGNAYFRKTYSVDFEQRKAEKINEERLKKIVISGAEANDW